MKLKPGTALLSAKPQLFENPEGLSVNRDHARGDGGAGFAHCGAMKPTAGLFSRSDPRQPTDAEIYAAAEATIAAFDGNLGRARSLAISEAIHFEAEGDRTRNLVAVRLSRAIRELTRQQICKPKVSR